MRQNFRAAEGTRGGITSNEMREGSCSCVQGVAYASSDQKDQAVICERIIFMAYMGARSFDVFLHTYETMRSLRKGLCGAV